MKDELRGKRVAIYARVSTQRQAANDISLPDQIDQLERWKLERGSVHVATFIEPGASATNDRRTQFQALVAMATRDDHPIDVIITHSLSRMFRNALDYMKYKVLLRRHKVRIVSITQDFGDDPGSDLAMGMLALFDEYHSAENAKHVKRTMLANAARGYWNGQTPPIGYRTVAVPQAKGKDRKKLEPDPATEHLPRLIFETYVRGTSDGPMGITRLAHWLNERGERIRGRPFHVSNVHAILTNTAYVGVVMYNQRDSRTGEIRPEDDWVPIPVPPLIDEDLFYAARSQMTSRDPRMGTSAVKSGTNLLTGHVVCGCGDDGCGGGMTTSTGKSGQYRHYACRKRSSGGRSLCDGRRIRMETLDDIVVDALAKHVLQPTRLKALLQEWLDRGEAASADRRAQLKRLRSRLTLLEGESANVIKLVRNQICSPDDPQIASELGNIAAQKAAVMADIAMLERQLTNSSRSITPEIIDKFGNLIASRIKARDDDRLRKAYVRQLVDRVMVGEREIRITGSTASLAQLAVSVEHQTVPNTERKWCARQDSNLRPQA